LKKPKIAEGAEAKKIQEAPVADENAAVDAMKNAKMIPHHVAEYLPLVGSAPNVPASCLVNEKHTEKLPQNVADFLPMLGLS